MLADVWLKVSIGVFFIFDAMGTRRSSSFQPRVLIQFEKEFQHFFGTIVVLEVSACYPASSVHVAAVSWLSVPFPVCLARSTAQA